jgi:hypothetical protein
VRGSGKHVVLHGHCIDKSPTYNTWCAMKQRCNYKKSISYKHYGGRGIKVCDRWNVFDNFLEDMGERPDGMTLDRIDNNSNYYKENCKWSTWGEQVKNRRERKKTDGCTSRYKGVHLYKNKWKGTVTKDGVRIHTGYYDTEDMAYESTIWRKGFINEST